MDSLATQSACEFSCLAAEFQIGTSAGVPYHLNVLPCNPVAQARTDGLHACLLGSKAGGQPLGGVRLAQAVASLFRGKNTLEKAFPKALHRSLDPVYLSDVNPCAYNHLRRSAKVP